MLETEARNPKTTHIDKMSAGEIIDIMNEENAFAVAAVQKERDAIAAVTEAVTNSIKNGGRLFYIGAGTSGRLGVVDAAECPPTFGVSPELVCGIIAGGIGCMVAASENAEDSYETGAADIVSHGAKCGDVVMGISAAGGAAYVVGALEKAKELGCITAGLTCNPDTAVLKACDLPICTRTGAEVITGSTRLKAGTAQKLVLNMISTASMVLTGKVYENFMINLRPSNIKLKKRMIGIVCELRGCDGDTAEKLLDKNSWSIRACMEQK